MDQTTDIDHYYEEGEGRQRQDQAELEEMRKIERLERENQQMREALEADLGVFKALQGWLDARQRNPYPTSMSNRIDSIVNLLREQNE